MIVDSIIVALYVNITSRPGYVFNLILFTSFVLFFVVISFIFLAYSRKVYMTKTLAKDYHPDLDKLNPKQVKVTIDDEI
jgi:hypothetical protein